MSGLRTPARLLPRKRRAAGPQYARWQGSTRFPLLPTVCTHPTQPSSSKCRLDKNFRGRPRLLQLATFSARSRGGEAPEPRFRACQTIRLPLHTKPATDSPSVRFSLLIRPHLLPVQRSENSRTSRFTGGEPYGNPWRDRCVSSWRAAGSPYGGSDCSLPFMDEIAFPFVRVHASRVAESFGRFARKSLPDHQWRFSRAQYQ
jgi:hypothetical protein